MHDECLLACSARVCVCLCLFACVCMCVCFVLQTNAGRHTHATVRMSARERACVCVGCVAVCVKLSCLLFPRMRCPRHRASERERDSRFTSASGARVCRAISEVKREHIARFARRCAKRRRSRFYWDRNKQGIGTPAKWLIILFAVTVVATAMTKL